MRILFVAPYPPSRIRVRSYGFLQQLRREHEVVVMVACRSGQELADADKLREQGYEVVVVQEPGWQALLRSGMALAGGTVPCANPRSLQEAYARSRRFMRAFERLCMQRHFDVVHVEHVRGMAAIEPLAQDLPLVWDAVDCLSLLYKYTMVAGPSLAMRSVARIEQKRLQRYEACLVNKVRNVLVTSERDRQALIELQCLPIGNRVEGTNRDGVCLEGQMGATIEVLPNGVDLDYFRPLREKRRRFNIVFSGTMSYHPNVATALYLYRRVMPRIWSQRPEVTLTLVGSSPPKVIRRLAGDARVVVTGYVDDMRPYIGRAEVMLCPMVYSVGIQNKVLEAMAMGTPVVVTPQTAEAFEAKRGRDLLVAETPEGFAEAALRVLEESETVRPEERRNWSVLSRDGRAYVEQHHDWRAVTKRLVEIYSQAIRSFRPAERS